MRLFGHLEANLLEALKTEKLPSEEIRYLVAAAHWDWRCTASLHPPPGCYKAPIEQPRRDKFEMSLMMSLPALSDFTHSRQFFYCFVTLSFPFCNIPDPLSAPSAAFFPDHYPTPTPPTLICHYWLLGSQRSACRAAVMKPRLLDCGVSGVSSVSGAPPSPRY